MTKGELAVIVYSNVNEEHCNSMYVSLGFVVWSKSRLCQPLKFCLYTLFLGVQLLLWLHFIYYTVIRHN